MTQKLKTVAKILSYSIRKFFIISNRYIDNILQIIQQTVAVDNEKLHYIKKRIDTSFKRRKTFPQKRGNKALPIFEGNNEE